MIPILIFFGLCTLAVSACLPFAKELPNVPPHEISAFEIVGSMCRIQFVRGPLDGHFWDKLAIPLSGQTCAVTVKSTGKTYLYRAVVTGWGTVWVHEYKPADGVVADHVYEWEFGEVVA